MVSLSNHMVGRSTLMVSLSTLMVSLSNHEGGHGVAIRPPAASRAEKETLIAYDHERPPESSKNQQRTGHPRGSTGSP